MGLVGSGPSRSWSEGGFVRRGPPVRRRAAHAYAAVAAAGVVTVGWSYVLRRQRRREAELLVAHQGQVRVQGAVYPQSPPRGGRWRLAACEERRGCS